MVAASKLAGIQYVGLPGISHSCVHAIQRMLQYGDDIATAKLLTCRNRHCLLLVVDEHDEVAVKSGFASGYSGEGPRALARALRLLLQHDVDVEEIEVEGAVLDRLDASSLTRRDLLAIRAARAVRPTRIYDYTDVGRESVNSLGEDWDRFPLILPLSIIDTRIADLAIRFQEAPNDTLLQGFRRLEDVVRRRTESRESGAKLFSQAFMGDAPKLTWEEVQAAEAIGRGKLFTGTFMAHRNPRAHSELREDMASLLSEFIVLNHLFRLEASAVAATGVEPEMGGDGESPD